MKRLLNTLYIMTPTYRIAKDGDNIVILEGKNEIGRFPTNILSCVVSFSFHSITSQTIQMCSENNIRFSVMSPYGKYIGSFDGPIKGNVILRRRQYRLADDRDVSLYLSKQMITSKIHNSIELMKRSLKDHSDNEFANDISLSIEKLKMSIEKINDANDVDEIRGVEGDSARCYFDSFDHLIRHDKNIFFMKNRNRRPPTDRVNALLSFLYTVLMNDVKSSIEAIGMDPYVGFMHTDRPGRPSLALDMMEELRPAIDRLVLNLINLKNINGDDFTVDEFGTVLLSEGGRKIVLDKYQKGKWNIVTNNYLRERIEFGLVPHVQSMLLARYIRGDCENYYPYLM